VPAVTAIDPYDVAVVGAGAAGATAALLLARAGVRVVLMTTTSTRSDRPTEVCSPTTLRLMRALGLPSPDAASHARECRGVLSAWDTPSPQFFDYGLFACEPALAIDRPAYDAALVAAAQTAGAAVVTHRGPATVARAGRTWMLSSASTRVHAGWLVDASGRGGGLAPRITSRRCFSDRLVACAMRQPRRDAPSVHDDLLLLAAVRGGWWYASWNGSADATIVYLTDADLLPRAASARSAHLARAFDEARLLHDGLEAPPFTAHRVADARTSHRPQVAGDGWMAIGDAALSVDPLSGDGLRLAIASAAAASDALIAARAGVPASEGFTTWYREQWIEQRRAATAAYAPVVQRFTDDAFWRRRHAAVLASPCSCPLN